MEFSIRLCFKLSAAGSGTLMDKVDSSRKQNRWQSGGSRMLCTLAFLACIAPGPQILAAVALSHSDALRIGKKIWQNECNGTIAGLTSWNAGENFASLGIGHFIWYPKNQRGPFEESFPELVNFVSAQGVKLPQLLSGGQDTACPWNSRAEFQQAIGSAKMRELRQFLVETIDLQAQFLVARLESALPKMLAETTDRENVQRQFDRVAA